MAQGKAACVCTAQYLRGGCQRQGHRIYYLDLFENVMKTLGWGGEVGCGGGSMGVGELGLGGLLMGGRPFIQPGLYV